nr:hypothetical protein [Streptomyces sp. TLI_185]
MPQPLLGKMPVAAVRHDEDLDLHVLRIAHPATVRRRTDGHAHVIHRRRPCSSLSAQVAGPFEAGHDALGGALGDVAGGWR